MSDRRVRVTLDLIATGYRSGVEQAKKATDDLTAAMKRQAVEQGLTDKQRSQMALQAAREQEQAAERQRQAYDRTATAMLTAGAAILAGVGLTAKAAMDWESQFAGVRKTVDGTGEQIRALEGDLRGMATSMATSH